jgi:hypothetical protein
MVVRGTGQLLNLHAQTRVVQEEIMVAVKVKLVVVIVMLKVGLS